MVVPSDISQVDYGASIRFFLTAADDRTQILGRYTGLYDEDASEDRRRRLSLPLTRNCRESCDAYYKNFEWSIVSHDEREIAIQLNFDDPNQVSTMNQDEVGMEVVDTQLFVSDVTGEELKRENVEAMYCEKHKAESKKGTTCLNIPP